MESSGVCSQRRRSLGIDSPNLRDFLRVTDEDEGRKSLASLFQSTIHGNEKRPSPAQVNRTLLDIIRDDPNGGFKDNKKSWKIFRDKLRLRCNGASAAWTSAISIPAASVPILNSNGAVISPRNSTRSPTTPVVNADNPTPESTQAEMSRTVFAAAISGGESGVINSNSISSRISTHTPSLPAAGEGRLVDAIRRDGSLNNGSEPLEQHLLLAAAMEIEEAAMAEEEEEPVRMSLMALLEETERPVGSEGGACVAMDDDEEEREAAEEEHVRSVGYNDCCVCMVRHRGAAFIPCGHTFCRLCSRELWVRRGNCPLCNGSILEILDIF